MGYIIKGRLIDAISDEAVEDGIVVTRGETIEYAGSAEDYKLYESAENMAVVEVHEGSIMPGFIDCHAHLTGQEDAGDSKAFGDRLLGAAYELGLLLDAGFTGVRDMSEAGLYLSRAVERGILKGPRILPGGKIIGITGGHVDMDPEYSKEFTNKNSHFVRLADGAADCLSAVREQFRAGAKFIKICATGGVSSPTDRIDDVQFSPEELEVMVDEARRHHTYVCAHCTGNEGAYQALLAGVNCIEHGVMLTQREIDLMAERGATLVTTLSVSLGVAKMQGFPKWMTEKAKKAAEYNMRTIEMARKASIRIALGTDYSNSKNTPYRQLGAEFTAMAEAGLTPIEAIRAGTINAAHLMLNDRIGSLEAGKAADIVIVDGNPLKDIRVLHGAEHIRYVFTNGKIVKEDGKDT
jgi:imidazolonepropionase-like amidohydrolase